MTRLKDPFSQSEGSNIKFENSHSGTSQHTGSMPVKLLQSLSSRSVTMNSYCVSQSPSNSEIVIGKSE